MSRTKGIDAMSAASELRTSMRVLPHAESTATSREKGSQGFVVIGGCHGLILLPAEELADFYKGYGCVAVAGLVWLGIVVLVRLVS